MAKIGYKGISFPFRFDHRGAVAGSDTLASSPDHVLESVKQILGVRKGERVMRPEFGADADDMVFAPQSNAFLGLSAHNAQKALKRWEPRVEVRKVEVVKLEGEKAFIEAYLRVLVNKRNEVVSVPLEEEE